MPRGVCATSHPLGVEAGLELLRQGGNAVDAAIAMAAALTVVEPTSNGLGSDAFALVWAEGNLHGLNGSGRSPKRMAPLPDPGDNLGWPSVTVPGAPKAWVDLHDRFGKADFSKVLVPAIRLAELGGPVPKVAAHYWAKAHRRYGRLTRPEFCGWNSVFAPGGSPPEEGALFRSPDHGTTLRRLAETRCNDFYQGETARAIVAFSEDTGGTLSSEDLASHVSEWVEPVQVNYRHAEVWEIPPNTQGVVALSALGMLQSLPPMPSPQDAGGAHRAIEAVKCAFADAQAHVAEPKSMQVSPGDFLHPKYLSRRAQSISEQAELRRTGLPQKGGTVYLAAVDKNGMMVSFIQSNFMGFGSGIVVPATGVSLQNRGAGFTSEPGHPNERGPGKRPFHTIIPGFLTRDGDPWGPFGVMGGHMQPQGHVQVVQGLVDCGLSPQQALDMPRWCWEQDLEVFLEQTRDHEWPDEVVRDLQGRGHSAKGESSSGRYGRGQIILLDHGSYRGGSDKRTDGFVGTV